MNSAVFFSPQRYPDVCILIHNLMLFARNCKMTENQRKLPSNRLQYVNNNTRRRAESARTHGAVTETPPSLRGRTNHAAGSPLLAALLPPSPSPHEGQPEWSQTPEPALETPKALPAWGPGGGWSQGQALPLSRELGPRKATEAIAASPGPVSRCSWLLRDRREARGGHSRN